MKTTFVVAWTGGYETPSFYTTTSREDANKCFEDWAKELREENGDQIDLLTIVFLGDGVLSQEVTRTAYTDVETGEAVLV